MSKANTPRSRKAKGRVYQQSLRDWLLEIDPFGMYESQTMGLPGSDIQDPAGRLPWSYVELRRHENPPSLNSVRKEMEKAPNDYWVFGTRGNNQQSLFIMSEEMFKRLVRAYFDYQYERHDCIR